MAESGCILSGENAAFVSDSTEAMHVDITPSISDREDEHSSVSGTAADVEFNTLFVETSREKLDQRAQRFGVDASVNVRPITETDVKSLYKSLDVDLKDATGISKPSKYRLDAIHMRGVNQMSTQDVFEYFKDHSPVSVEWVNDLSCNVVCLNPLCAARALLSLSQPIRRAPAVPEQKAGQLENVLVVSEPEEGEDVEMAENEQTVANEFDVDAIVGHSRRSSGDHVGTPVPNNSPIDASQIDEPIIVQPPVNPPAPAVANIGVEIDSTKIDVPLPPGPWRLGHSTVKAKGVLMRIANRSDRKIPGAEKLSQYYLKHGNPNFKGLKGIISNSLKRKMKDGYKRRPYVDLDAVEDDNVQFPSTVPVHEPVPEYAPRSKEQVTKRPRMRMYADDEEEKQKRSKPLISVVQTPSISLDPTDLRNRIASDHRSIAAGDGPDLRDKLWSTLSGFRHKRVDFDNDDDFDYVVEQEEEEEGEEPSSEGDECSDHRPSRHGSRHQQLHLSRPIVLRDLRSKLEQLREARQPKVPLLIEVSQDDV